MLKLALISEGVNTWPVYVALSRGLWAKAGLAVELTVTGSSIHQLEQLKSGGFDIGFQQVDHIVRGVERGADLFMFMAQSHAPVLSLMASKDIGGVADLKGKTIIVDDPRTGYSLLLRQLLSRHGLGVEEAPFKLVGGSQERFDAMKRGEGSACFINPPFDGQMLAAGFKRLGGSNDFFPDYPGPAAAARRSWACDHADELIAFIRGFNEAYAWLGNDANRDEAIRLLPARIAMPSDAAARALAQVYRQPRPQLSEDGVRQVMALVWAAEQFPTPMGSPAKYFDTRYLQKAGG
jgi:ABC-type nitrate/sulfonate/bicarbonate transport system substrate-binding protein